MYRVQTEKIFLFIDAKNKHIVKCAHSSKNNSQSHFTGFTSNVSLSYIGHSPFE